MLLLCACGFFEKSRAGIYFTSENQIALAEAAVNGQTDKIQQLLSAGTPINAQGKDGMTALIWALMHNGKLGFQYLLEHGADPDLQLTATDPSLDPYTMGNSAISIAAQVKDPFYLEIVLKHGGNPNLVNLQTTLTPIDDSIQSRLPEQAKMLIAVGANLNFQDRNGETPLVIAAMANSYDIVYALLEAGADPTIKNKWGNTIVYFIERSRTAPATEDYQWRSKTIDLLQAKGIEVGPVAGPSYAPIINVNSTPSEYLQNNGNH